MKKIISFKQVIACNDWQNISVLSIGRLPMHVPMNFFRFEKDVLNDDFDKTVKNLSGQWNFNYFPSVQQVPESWSLADLDDHDQIKVPGNWQLSGYDKPIYSNVEYPFKADAPQVPDDDPVGCYSKNFRLDDDWFGQDRIRLSFEGVGSAFYLWVNGDWIGYSEDSRLTAEFDITDHLKKGDNRIAALVFRWSKGSYLEDQDMWRMSGIFRQVKLYRVPKTAIEDFRYQTKLDQDFDRADLIVTSRLTKGSSYQDFSLKTKLYFDQRLIQEKTADFSTDDIDERGGYKDLAVNKMTVEDPKLWSCEQPDLYRLVVELFDKNRQLIQAEKTMVGFRKVEIDQGLIKINGKELLIRGVNKHEFTAATGYYVDHQTMLEDIRRLKEANFNAVRCSHYPNDPYWYDLCDRYGIYLVDEANIETHGMVR